MWQDAPPSWPDPYWDIPGQFCVTADRRGQCCQGRQDSCHRNILDTLCYCDTFCNRSVSPIAWSRWSIHWVRTCNTHWSWCTRTGSSDCCPDYFSHCLGLPGRTGGEEQVGISGSLTEGRVHLILLRNSMDQSISWGGGLLSPLSITEWSIRDRM